MEIKEKTYYPHLDYLKGLAILLMVMAHVIAWSYPDYSFLSLRWCDLTVQEFNAALLWKIIYSFHMPLLFFVSGFLFFKENDTESYLKKISKRFGRLLVPYITTGVFVLYLRDYFGYWFFIVLFVLNLIVIAELVALQKVKNKLWIELIVHLVLFTILIFTVRYLKDDLPKSLSHLKSLPTYYLIFMFGYMVHKYKQIENIILKPLVSLFCLVVFCGLFVMSNYYEIWKLNLLIPICAIVFLYNIFKGINISNIMYVRYLSIVGKNSMEIYIFHLFFTASFLEVGKYILNIENLPLSITIQLTYSLIVSVVAIVLSLMIANMLKSNTYLKKVVFGI